MCFRNLKRFEQLDIAASARAIDGQQVDKLIDWFNESLLRELTLCLDVTPDNWASVANMIQHFRDRKLSGKSDPQFRLFINDDVLGEVDLKAIEEMDVRLPRLEVNVLLRDHDGFSNLRERIAEVGGASQDLLLRIQPYLLVERCLDSLRTLDRQIDQECPLVEIEVAPSSDIEQLVNYIAEFWSRHPSIDAAISHSRGGFFHRFHMVKELWHFEQVLPSSEDWLDANLDSWNADDTLRTFCHSLVDRITMQDYYRWKYRRTSAAMEFDVDSISDSSECQSPVFVNSRWVIDEVQAAKEENLEVRQWGNPFAAS